MLHLGVPDAEVLDDTDNLGLMKCEVLAVLEKHRNIIEQLSSEPEPFLDDAFIIIIFKKLVSRIPLVICSDSIRINDLLGRSIAR